MGAMQPYLKYILVMIIWQAHYFATRVGSIGGLKCVDSKVLDVIPASDS